MARLVAVVGLAVVAITGQSSISSAAWAITPHWTYNLEGVNYPTGNRVCIRQWAGTYGSTALFFSQTVMRVDYGGNCNANWGRPAGELEAQSWSYGPGNTLQANSLLQTNPANSHIAQAEVYRWNSTVKVVSDVRAENSGTVYEFTTVDVY